ncbi:MAG TPA: cation:proton antiporter [Gemmatimonadaceae bacterium]|jgi:Kef-type K+ transport system membrane component KefB
MTQHQRSHGRFLPTYATLVGLPALALLVILRVGNAVVPKDGTLTTPLALPASGPAGHTTSAASFDLPLLLIQIIVILVAARLTGAFVRRLGQPQVVGEMIAGIALGPSVLGAQAPHLAALLFPAGSLGFLNTLSQIGLVVFMFLVGLELDPKIVRERGRSALVISHASIVAPFLLGATLAIVLYPTLAGSRVTFTGFALFMGAAMSVTAFPVLARILTERRLTRTPIGALAIACAAIDDVTAWCILAAVVVIVRATGSGVATGVPLWVTLGGSAAYVAFMLTGGRRALRILETRYAARGRVTQDMIAVLMLATLASAWITERLGIHALFGAFLVGAVAPKSDDFVHAVLERFEDMMVVLLLPLFFAFTGLRTEITLIDGAGAWLVCAMVTAVAVIGKVGGSAIAARVTAMPWRDAAVIGLLLNTRGLMELVILNIGLDIGVISRELFAMMVLMALATTFMTTPLVTWLLRALQREPADAHAVTATAR